MPDRIVRLGIISSDAVNKLSWQAEVFYRRLMSVADDYGRYDGRPVVLRAAMYPLKLDHVREADIATWIGECREAGLVRLYSCVESKPFVEIAKFNQRIQAKSKWPDPNAYHDSPSSTVIYGDPRLYSESDSKTKSDSMSGKPSRAKPASAQLTDDDWLKELKVGPAFKGIDVDRELARMDLWLKTPKGRGRTKTRKFILNWLGKIDVPMQGHSQTQVRALPGFLPVEEWQPPGGES